MRTNRPDARAAIADAAFSRSCGTFVATSQSMSPMRTLPNGFRGQIQTALSLRTWLTQPMLNLVEISSSFINGYFVIAPTAPINKAVEG